MHAGWLETVELGWLSTGWKRSSGVIDTSWVETVALLRWDGSRLALNDRAGIDLG
jgi:hypothetical protein